MSARSRWPSVLLSRKNWRSCWSAGARAGRMTVRALMIASSCARARLMESARDDARRDLLDVEAVARHGIAKLHREIVLVHPQPHVDHFARILLVHVAQVDRAHLSERDLDLFLAQDLQVELVVLALG